MSDHLTSESEAFALLDAGNLLGARAKFRDLLRERPQSANALAGLASTYLQGKPELALEYADAALAEHPSMLYALRIRALALQTKKRSKEALESINRAVEIGPYDPINHHVQAIILDHQNKRGQAEAAYRQSLSIEPDDPLVLSDFSQFLSIQNRNDEALQLADRAARLAPNSTSALTAKAETALREGRLDEATALIHEALRVDANNQMAINVLVQIKTRRNPVMGIWWSWASFMASLSSPGMRWAFIIGLWIAWQIFRRTILADAPVAVQNGAIVLWLGFCVLTWVGPSIYKGMIKRELKAVELKPDF